MEMLERVPVNTEKQERKDYTKIHNYTDKCAQLFTLLNEVSDFIPAEYYSLNSRKDEFKQFPIKMNAIAAIHNALNNEVCKEAIKDGYRLYVTENKHFKN